ncbi:hypothetical protein GAV69_20250 [Salmonella enterica subsp. enterica serovar Eastbourne]|nr:hypothetical protein [Salmonella enterica subsp. enterica serovar Eastbourne]
MPFPCLPLLFYLLCISTAVAGNKLVVSTELPGGSEVAVVQGSEAPWNPDTDFNVKKFTVDTYRSAVIDTGSEEIAKSMAEEINHSRSPSTITIDWISISGGYGSEKVAMTAVASGTKLVLSVPPCTVELPEPLKAIRAFSPNVTAIRQFPIPKGAQQEIFYMDLKILSSVFGAYPRLEFIYDVKPLQGRTLRLFAPTLESLGKPETVLELAPGPGQVRLILDELNPTRSDLEYKSKISNKYKIVQPGEKVAIGSEGAHLFVTLPEKHKPWVNGTIPVRLSFELL